jgi:hypothetical protein
MILYLKDPKDTTKKFLDLISTLNKVKGYKINMQKSVDVLYTNNEHTEKEMRKTIPFMVVPQNKIRYLRINLTRR